MQQTFYGHFVAGEDQDTIKPLIMANRQFGVKSILDYSAEEDLSQKEAVQAEMMWVMMLWGWGGGGGGGEKGVTKYHSYSWTMIRDCTI